MNNTVDTRLTQRLTSLDAYRGAIMISLISHGFGLAAFEGHPYLGFLARQVDHVPWEGCVCWDLIQPSFMFMVGVAMPFAYGKRLSLGESPGKIFIHALWRCFNLILIAAIFTSINDGHPTYTLVNVLPQIAFGYLMTFFVLRKSFATQGIVAVLILLVYTVVWIWYPGNGEGGPWAKGSANMGGDFEKWWMGQYNPGYWVSLNAIPSTSTIIAGAMCGRLLASDRSSREIMTILGVSAVALILAGFALGFYIPIVKRILTASFAVYSTGWAILFLLIFYSIIDVWGYKRWSFFLVVVGMNSIAAYVVFQLFRGWINTSILVFTSAAVQRMSAYGEVLQALLVLAAQWYVFYFCYKKNVFFKV
jgi:predicted acyltransferase